MGREHHHWGEVIALSEYRRVPEPPHIALVRRYWDQLRGPRSAPARAEVDPQAIASALGHAFILDRIAAGHARFRVAGMHLCDLMGMEVRGMPLAALFNPSSREWLGDTLADLFTGRHSLMLRLRADRGLGRPAIDGQMLLLPLADRHGALSRALGCLETQGEIGYPPRRFDLVEVGRQRIPDAPMPVEPRSSLAGRPRGMPQPGLAEPPAGFAPPTSGTRPRLRIVRSSDADEPDRG